MHGAREVGPRRDMDPCTDLAIMVHGCARIDDSPAPDACPDRDHGPRTDDGPFCELRIRTDKGPRMHQGRNPRTHAGKAVEGRQPGELAPIPTRTP